MSAGDRSENVAARLVRHHREMFGRLRIPEDLLARAGVRSVGHLEASRLVGNRRFDLGGVAFPHFRSGEGRPHSYVVRVDRPHDGIKYVCAPGAHDLYFSPGFESLLGDSTALAIFVESPKSVLALAALAERADRQWLAVGLGGCWGWRGRNGIETAADGSRIPVTGPHADLKLIALRDREVIVVFDSNVTSNPKVRAAEREFAKLLQEGGAKVRLARIPASPHVNGPDDYLAECGDAALLQVLLDAGPVETVGGIVGTQAASQEAKSTKAKRAVEIAMLARIELFHDGYAVPFARIRVEGHLETRAVGSRAFKLWLGGEFWRATEDPLAREPLNTAIDVLAAKALYEGNSRELHNRVAWHDDALYYDLGDTEWRAVKITSQGWDIVRDPPVLFLRQSHQVAQVPPARGGNVLVLQRFLNLTEDQRKLFIVALVAFFLPDIPRPVILVTGEHGSAKSTMLKVARELVDPSRIPLFGAPDPDEFPQVLAHHYCIPLDNIGCIGTELSDLLCRAVTGGGISKRKLYSDEDDVVLAFRRAVMVNSINPVVHRPDLLDRSIVLTPLPIPEDERRPEQEFWEDFGAAKAGILGGLFDLLSDAIRVRPTLRIDRLPRMADFATWGAAIADALGWGREPFLRAYRADADRRNQDAIEASPVAQSVLQLLERSGSWEGTSSALLRDLGNVVGELGIDLRSREWPKQPHVLSRRVNELIPVLRTAGVDVSHGYKGKCRVVKLALASMAPKASEASVPSVSTENTSGCESTKTNASDATDGISATMTSDSNLSGADMPLEGDL